MTTTLRDPVSVVVGATTYILPGLRWDRRGSPYCTSVDTWLDRDDMAAPYDDICVDRLPTVPSTPAIAWSVYSRHDCDTSAAMLDICDDTSEDSARRSTSSQCSGTSVAVRLAVACCQ